MTLNSFQFEKFFQIHMYTFPSSVLVTRPTNLQWRTQEIPSSSLALCRTLWHFYISLHRFVVGMPYVRHCMFFGPSKKNRADTSSQSFLQKVEQQKRPRREFFSFKQLMNAQKLKNVSEDQKTTKTMCYTSVQIHT